MSKFRIRPDGTDHAAQEYHDLAGRLRSVENDVWSTAGGISRASGGVPPQVNNLNRLASDLRSEADSAQKYGWGLTEVGGTYRAAERRAGGPAAVRETKNAIERALARLKDIMGGRNRGVSGSDAYSKDPVSLTSGNLIYDHFDVMLGGVQPLVFHRFYNSQSREDGVLGAGWTHNFNMSLRFGESETLGVKTAAVVRWDGREETFYSPDGSSYVSGEMTAARLLSDGGDYVYLTDESEKYRFNADGQLLRIDTESGSGMSFSYGEDGRLARVLSDESTSISFAYDEDGHLVSLTDSLGRTTLYGIEDGLLLSVTRPDGGLYTYRYNEAGMLTAAIDPLGNADMQAEYDENGRCISQTFADGGKMTYAYDPDARVTRMTERNGSVSEHYYDEKFRNIRNVWPYGEESFTYNEKDQKTSITDRLGNTTRISYDGYGNAAQIIDARGGKTSLTYNAMNQPLTLSVNGRMMMKNVYDKDGRLLSQTDAAGRETRISYHANGRPETITQPDGSRISYGYDEKGRIVSVVNALGGEIRAEYDDAGQITKIRDSRGREETYTYDAAGNLTEAKDAAGFITRRDYDGNDRIITVTLPDGGIYQRTFDAAGLPEKETDPLGRVTAFTYDRMWNRTEERYPDGAKVTYAYDAEGRLIKVTDPYGKEETYAYDAAGNMVAMTDEEGFSKAWTYDELGRIASATGPNGFTVRNAYDAYGNLVSRTGDDGAVMSFVYNEVGEPVRFINPDGTEVRFTYTPMGDTASLTDEEGITNRYTYAPGGEFITKIEYDGDACEQFAYDAFGSMTGYTDVFGNHYEIERDIMDRVTAVRGSDGSFRYYTYDPMGRILSETDSFGNTKQYAYDAVGNLISAVDALGHKVEYTYDKMDRLTEILRENACTHRYTYDLMGRLLKAEDALGNTESYNYNARSELIRKKDADGFETAFSYTPAGDLETVRYADGSETGFAYNGRRFPVEMRDKAGRTQIENDCFGRLLRVVYPDGRALSVSYDRRGARKGMVYPDGTEVTYEYDAHGQMRSMETGGNKTEYAYDPIGRLVEKKLPGGIRMALAYKDSGEIESLSYEDKDGLLESCCYAFDAEGRRTKTVRQKRGLPEASSFYRYDAAGQLIEEEQDGVRTVYEYDPRGNRIREMRGDREIFYRYDKADRMTERRTETDGAESIETYAYDRRGNRTAHKKDGALLHSYTFGADGRLAGAENALGMKAEYTYNGLGMRTGQKITSMADGAERAIRYVSDLTRDYFDKLEREENGSTESFLQDATGYAASVSGKIGDYAAFLVGELGSILREAGAKGETRASAEYDSFGAFYYKEGETAPFGYLGFTPDPVTGLWHANAREYDPVTGRFLSRDYEKGDVYDPRSQNEYIYCGNDPYSYADYDGYFWHIVAGAAIGAVAKGGIEAVSQIARGEKVNWKKVGAAAAGGAVEYGIKAACPGCPPAVAAAAGGATKGLVGGLAEGKKPAAIVQDMATEAATEAAWSWVSGKIDKLPGVSKVKDKVMGTKAGKLVENLRIFGKDKAGKETLKNLTKDLNPFKHPVKALGELGKGMVGEFGYEAMKKVYDATLGLGIIKPKASLKSLMKAGIGQLIGVGGGALGIQGLCTAKMKDWVDSYLEKNTIIPNWIDKLNKMTQGSGSSQGRRSSAPKPCINDPFAGKGPGNFNPTFNGIPAGSLCP